MFKIGRIERAEGDLKKHVKLARRREEATSDQEFATLGTLCCSMRNRYNSRLVLHRCRKLLLAILDF